MSETTPHPLLPYLHDTVGGNLRSLVSYDRTDATVHYVREDVRASYTEEELAAIVGDVRLEGVGKPYQEGLYEHGPLVCSVRCFERGVEFQFVQSDTQGTIVALERGVFPDVDSFVEACRERLPAEV